MDINNKFEDMKPVNSAPSLFGINGCGLRLYGAFDRDNETNSCISLYVITILFVPIFVIGAYRVAASSGDKYVIGKVPVFGWAKMWNLLLISSIAIAISVSSWTSYINSPDYRAKNLIAEGDELLVENKVGEATEKYYTAYGLQSKLSDDCINKITGIVTDDNLDKVEASQYSLIVKTLVKNNIRIKRIVSDKELVTVSMAVINNNRNNDPKSGYEILKYVQRIDNKKDYQELKIALLENIISANPKDIEAAGVLAQIYEASGNLGKCQSVLMPNINNLGSTEGARILGQILTRQGEYEKAYKLLLPYTDERIKQLINAEKKYNDLVNKFYDDSYSDLKAGKASDSFYDRYDRGTQEEQDELVNDYISHNMKNDKNIEQALDEYREKASIVPVALDLGMVMLYRGSKLTEENLRKQELEAAEKVFLSIAGIARNSDEYRINLGQVYFWLGKKEEGQKLFEEILVANKRSYSSLMSLGYKYRELGDISQARILIEEAYSTGKTDLEKQDAAGMRSVIFKDLDDKVQWLSKCDKTSLYIKADLYESKGDLAARKGEKEESIRQYEKAIGIYKTIPESSTNYNNAALIYLSLYRASGSLRSLNESIELMEKAINLSPSDSILIGNAADSILRAAMMDIIGDRIDLQALKSNGSLSMLRFFYNNSEQRSIYTEIVKKHSGIAKYISMNDKNILLSPKNPTPLSSAYRLLRYIKDIPALEELGKKVQNSDLDLVSNLQQIIDFNSGKDDQKIFERIDSSIEKSVELIKNSDKYNDITRAVVVSGYIENILFKGRMGQDIDSGKMLNMAKDLYESSPSSGTMSVYYSALAYKACESISQKNSKFKELYSVNSRSVYPINIIGITVEDEQLRENILDDKYVKIIAQLMKGEFVRYPKTPNYIDWIILKNYDADLAEDIAISIRNDEMLWIDNVVYQTISYMDSDAIAYLYFEKLFNGDKDGALKLASEAVSNGVSLPISL